MTTYIYFVLSALFLLMPITFEAVHTCLPIHNTNAYEVVTKQSNKQSIANAFILNYIACTCSGTRSINIFFNVIYLKFYVVST